MSTVQEKERSEIHTERELQRDYQRVNPWTERSELNYNYEKIERVYPEEDHNIIRTKVYTIYYIF